MFEPALFDIKAIPPYQFHLISQIAPFTMKEKREAIVYAHLPGSGEQINLVVTDKASSNIAGCAVIRVCPSETVIVDFYILDRFRHKGTGRSLMGKVESISRERGVRRINTGKSLQSDNKGMVEFCKKMGFVKLPVEIYHFSQPISAQKKRIQRISSLDYGRFLPQNNRIVRFTQEYFEPVYEMALNLFGNQPFYSDALIYQILLVSSERYSHILVEGNRVNGFAVFSSTGSNVHLNFIVVRDRFQRLGLPMFLIGAGLSLAYKDGKTTFSYIAHKTDKLFKDIHQIFQQEPDFVTIHMEKTIS